MTTVKVQSPYYHTTALLSLDNRARLLGLLEHKDPAFAVSFEEAETNTHTLRDHVH